MWQYRDYLTVSKDFIPVFSAAVDSKHKSTWKFFIPHKAMHDILQKLTKALERNNVGDSRSLWMTGAYGTGKTFASFVIKHLLEDDLDEIEDYFQKHKMITPLWLRFKALRERNRYLVVYRSSSAHINSNRKLLMEIQEAIKEQLKNKGYKNAYTKGILDTIMEKITEGLFNWEGIYSKYRDRFLTIGSSEEVIDRLRSGDIKTSEKVAQVLEEEGVNLADTPHEVVAWIKEVIVENELQGIVFIWDEFTEFFANNVPVTSLQELAHATAEMPFYLFLVTHRALNQFSRIDDDTRQKLLDRFHNSQLEMSPVTAYLLIANVIEPIPEVKADWETRRESLWGPVDRIMMYINLLGGDNVHREEVKQLAPIHPFSAYLLATISSLYSSSQRTLFQFLKTEEHGSFQWFLGNYPKENCYWLTPDFLWEYFFENTKIESAHEINDILSHYFSVKDSLDNDDELAVFRVMLLLTALWRQTGGSNKLLKPSLSILQRMFLGTDLAQKTPQAAESLCTRGAMLALNAGNDCEYIIPTMTIDQEKLKQARNWAEKTLAFEKVISMDKAVGEFASDLRRLLLLRGAGEKRHKEIQIISGKDLKQRGERVISSLEKTYEIGLIMVTAQEDEQLNDTEQKAIEISKLYSNHVIIISQSPFGKKRWQEWLDCRARQRYAEEMRDGNSQRYYESKAKALGNEWLAELKAGRLRSIFRGKQSELAGMEVISDYLSEICSKVFPYGPETLNKIATLYTNSFGKAGAEIGLNVANNNLRPYKDVTDELDSQGLWADSKVLNTRPDHPLSRMKVVINDTMDESSNSSIKSLWEKLEQPPFGLMPSPIGILLFAFLLRYYANGHYYSDGANSYPLNPNKLAELIDAVVKNARMSENYSLR